MKYFSINWTKLYVCVCFIDKKCWHMLHTKSDIIDLMTIMDPNFKCSYNRIFTASLRMMSHDKEKKSIFQKFSWPNDVTWQREKVDISEVLMAEWCHMTKRISRISEVLMAECCHMTKRKSRYFRSSHARVMPHDQENKSIFQKFSWPSDVTWQREQINSILEINARQYLHMSQQIRQAFVTPLHNM